MAWLGSEGRPCPARDLDLLMETARAARSNGARQHL
jgi:hypothetical protein